MNLQVLTLTVLHILIFINSNISELCELPDYPAKETIYSGYLNIGKSDKKFHYVLVESRSDPENDPLVLWLNGGPGCSSLGGFSVENGPAVIRDGTTYFQYNHYSWNTNANVIYLESPAGTGFSYSENGVYYNNDEITAKDNLLALISFFEKFPNLKKNQFYITGESYAGVYLPYLANNIIIYNENASKSEKINLVGMMVGDGVTLAIEDTNETTREFDIKRNIVSDEVAERYREVCKNQKSYDCRLMKNKINYLIQNIDPFHIYKKCGVLPTTLIRKNKIKSKNHLINYDYLNQNYKPPAYNCVIDAQPPLDYFNRIDVKKALHVKLDIFFQDCGGPYVDYTLGSFHLYPSLIKSGLNILFYSGDADSAVPFVGTFKWISELKLKVKKNWRPWRIEKNRNSGFIIEYDGLTLVTVQGTGHMVAEWKPKEALHILNHFIHKTKL